MLSLMCVAKTVEFQAVPLGNVPGVTGCNITNFVVTGWHDLEQIVLDKISK